MSLSVVFLSDYLYFKFISELVKALKLSFVNFNIQSDIMIWKIIVNGYFPRVLQLL